MIAPVFALDLPMFSLDLNEAIAHIQVQAAKLPLRGDPHYACLMGAPLMQGCLEKLGFQCELIGHWFRPNEGPHAFVVLVGLADGGIVDGKGNRELVACRREQLELACIESPALEKALLNSDEDWEPIPPMELDLVLSNLWGQLTQADLDPLVDQVVAAIHQQWIEAHTQTPCANPVRGLRL